VAPVSGGADPDEAVGFFPSSACDTPAISGASSSSPSSFRLGPVISAEKAREDGPPVRKCLTPSVNP